MAARIDCPLYCWSRAPNPLPVAALVENLLGHLAIRTLMSAQRHAPRPAAPAVAGKVEGGRSPGAAITDRKLSPWMSSWSRYKQTGKSRLRKRVAVQ